MPLAELIEIVDLMLAKRVRRVSLAALSVELDASAFVPEIKPDAVPARNPDLCACGHDNFTEHSTAGCLRGCGADLCSSTEH